MIFPKKIPGWLQPPLHHGRELLEEMLEALLMSGSVPCLKWEPLGMIGVLVTVCNALK